MINLIPATLKDCINAPIGTMFANSNHIEPDKIEYFWCKIKSGQFSIIGNFGVSTSAAWTINFFKGYINNGDKFYYLTPEFIGPIKEKNLKNFDLKRIEQKIKDIHKVEPIYYNFQISKRMTLSIICGKRNG